MILNPGDTRWGAEEKEYTITNNTQLSFPTSAKGRGPLGRICLCDNCEEPQVHPPFVYRCG